MLFDFDYNFSVEKNVFYGTVNIIEDQSMTVESSSFNKYSLVKGAARRARQLQSGAPPLTTPKSMKACRVAQDEIRAGYVTYVLNRSAVPSNDPIH